MYTSVQDKGEDTIMDRANVTKTERINLRLNEVTKRTTKRPRVRLGRSPESCRLEVIQRHG